MQSYEKVLYQESRTGCHSFRKFVINSFARIYKRFQSYKMFSDIESLQRRSKPGNGKVFMWYNSNVRHANLHKSHFHEQNRRNSSGCLENMFMEMCMFFYFTNIRKSAYIDSL